MKDNELKDQENFYNGVLKIIDGLETMGNKVKYFFDNENESLVIVIRDTHCHEDSVWIPIDNYKIKFIKDSNYTKESFENDFKKYMEEENGR